MSTRASAAKNWDVRRRTNILQDVFNGGTTGNTCSGTLAGIFVAAVAKGKNVKPKRPGAHATKSLHNIIVKIGEDESEEQRAQFRALAVRANYWALGRPDIAFAANELCRQFSQPTSQSIMAVTRLVRYLDHKPRPADHAQDSLKTSVASKFADTCCACCLATKRSTNGGLTRMGPHLLKHTSATQPTISLPSGDAEPIGIARGAS